MGRKRGPAQFLLPVRLESHHFHLSVIPFPFPFIVWSCRLIRIAGFELTFHLVLLVIAGLDVCLI